MFTIDEIDNLEPAELMAAIRWADAQCQVSGASEASAVRRAAARRLAAVVVLAGDRHLDLAKD